MTKKWRFFFTVLYLGTVERTNGLVIHEFMAWSGRLCARQTNTLYVRVMLYHKDTNEWMDAHVREHLSLSAQHFVNIIG